MSATTTELLSSGEFCKLRYDTIPVKSALQTFLSISITQKCQILSFDTLVANELYNIHHVSAGVGNYVLKLSHVLHMW